MRMPVEKNIDIIRDMIRWYVLEAELQAASHNIDNQRPFEIAVAISPHKDDWYPDRPQFIENRFRTDVAEMPDLVRALRHLPHTLRQAIVRVGKNEHAPSFFRFWLHNHIEFGLSSRQSYEEYMSTLDENTVWAASAGLAFSQGPDGQVLELLEDQTGYT